MENVSFKQKVTINGSWTCQKLYWWNEDWLGGFTLDHFKYFGEEQQLGHTVEVTLMRDSATGLWEHPWKPDEWTRIYALGPSYLHAYEALQNSLSRLSQEDLEKMWEALQD